MKCPICDRLMIQERTSFTREFAIGLPVKAAWSCAGCNDKLLVHRLTIVQMEGMPEKKESL